MTDPGHRVQWTDVPNRVRADLERALGSAVVEAVNQRGGYGPSLAARCGLADGRRAFIKAVSPAQNPDSPGMMRREGRVAAALPADAPAPELLHAYDDGDWVALVFAEVDGRLPHTPWDSDELDRVLAATLALGDLVPRASLDTVAQHYGALFTGWRILADEVDDAPVDEWCRARIDELAQLEAGWVDATRGNGLIHGDVRSDNVLLTDDRVVFVDWTSTCTGAPWFEVVAMLPSVELEGGGAPEAALARLGLEIPRDNLLPLVVALAGYFAERSRLADPPGLPTVRAFQRAQGAVTNAWLRRLWERA
jgi:aminoglycoside phosphotransferase (APT) family kinase protein